MLKLPVVGTVALLLPITPATQAIAAQPVLPALSVPEVNFQPLSVAERSNSEQMISQWCDEINSAADRYGVDKALVAAIIFDELERWDRYYFNPTGTRNSRWVYSGDDTVTSALASRDPKLAMKRDWSIGIAQMQPQTAQNLLGDRPLPAVKALLDESKSIELVAAWIDRAVDEWRESYPEIENRPDIIATLYSQGYQASDIRGCPTSDLKGCPESNERGKEIANDMRRLQALLDEPLQKQAVR